MVYVCDCIMGSGKTSAAINYMNSHKQSKFIYVTPFLAEAARIKKACPDLRFVEPSNRIPMYNFQKHLHTAALIQAGRNITTTHSAFRSYSKEMLQNIHDKGYTLILDENFDTVQSTTFHKDDVRILEEAGYIKDENDTLTLLRDDYCGDVFDPLFSILRCREMIKVNEKDRVNLYYWSLPPDLITSFKDVYILTYLFKGQSLNHMLDIHNIPYEYIGVHRSKRYGYTFGELPGTMPKYVPLLKDMIDIDDSRLNDIGDDYYALSMTWFEKNSDVKQLKRNIYNYFNNKWRTVPANQKMWGSFKDGYDALKGKGYTKSFLTFNAKSTNEYRDRRCAAYLCNVFMNVDEKKFYGKFNQECNESTRALSIMVQWIWRSAIRDGENIHLYVPSRRMRELLVSWIDTVSKGGEVIAA